MASYYNEVDPFAAQWLRSLILQGHLPRGDVDTRSIAEVSPDDLKPYTQCHFFAGIGGWAYALRLAMWDDARPIWTGSCPCQPFSAAGRQQGKADERHLWPVWFRLIRKCRPSIVAGEQVASAIAHEWLDEAAHDLEGKGYAVAAAVLPACSVGAPHRRDRLWFVADADHAKRRPDMAGGHFPDRNRAGWLQKNDNASERSASALQHTASIGQSGRATASCPSTPSSDVADTSQQRRNGSRTSAELDGSAQSSHDRAGHGLEWLDCPDAKARPVKSGIRLLANGIPARVAKLRGFGNAIVPQVAAEFMTAYMECRP
jgi:DNA (cytosine-5)-methyltransferase 1